jgi:hypothetical protein
LGLLGRLFHDCCGKLCALKEALALPEKHQAFGALMIGYPRFRYQRIPIRKEPKIIWR